MANIISARELSRHILMGFLCCLVARSSGMDDSNYHSHIYGGEQLDDYIMATDGTFKTDKGSVLVIYDPTCRDRLKEFDIMEKGLPAPHYAAFLQHDYITSRDRTWYKWSSKEDLNVRYNAWECPTVVFIPQDKNIYQDASSLQRWTARSGLPFKQWVWAQLAREVTVRSVVEGASVMIGVLSDQPTTNYYELQAGGTRTIKVHMSDLIFAQLKIEDGEGARYEFLGGWVVTKDTPTLLIKRKEETGNVSEGEAEKKAPVATIDEWLAATRAAELQKTVFTLTWMQSHARRHLLNLKQPIMVKIFTDTGYKKGLLPTDLYKEVLTYYHENRKNASVQEVWNGENSYINQNMVKCSMIWLTNALVEKIKFALQVRLEQWCKCKLKFQILYGIREYHTGNVLRNHVDHVDTHVVSAIIQIARDLDGHRDWQLEVIDWSGKRQRVNLEPGEMLFYESTSLIHGRPDEFLGKRYANIFVHFSPIDWEFDLAGVKSGERIIFKNKVEHLFPLNTELTDFLVERRYRKPKRDEL